MKKYLTALLSTVICSSLMFNSCLTFAGISKETISNADFGISSNSNYVSVISDASKHAISYGDSLKVDSNGMLYISKSYAELGISKDYYNTICSGVSIENNFIKSGEIKITADSLGNITSFEIANSNPNEVASERTLSISEKSSNMMNNSTPIETNIRPMGGGIYFSNSDLTNLGFALGTGSASAWLTAELAAAGFITAPASVPLGVIAAASALGSGMIFWYASTGYGLLFTPINGIWTVRPLNLSTFGN